MIGDERGIKEMLLYLSVGDALGKICSKYDKKRVNEIYGGKITGLTKPIRSKSVRDWQRGDVTDDTILTLLVADSLIENQCFNRRDIAKRLIECDPKGGKQIDFLKKSQNLDYIAITGDTNGAAIRVSPLSVVYPNLEELTKNVIQLSTLTHGSDESITAALATSYALHYCLEHLLHPLYNFINDSLSKYFPLSKETQFVKKLNEAFCIAKHSNLLHLPDELEKLIGYEKYAWSSVPTAIVIGSILDKPYEALIEIIHRNVSGGDLDSVAGIAGSLLGLRIYDESIIKMGEEIEEHNGYSFDKYAKELKKLREKNE